MKKFLLLLLCLIVACLSIVSCAEREIGQNPPNYEENSEVVEELTLNVYIISESETTENAKTTVSRMISQYTETKYKTKLNVYYLSADGYEDAIKAKINSTGADAANIILVNDKSIVDDNVSKLVDMTGYLSADLSKSEIGKLNSQIPSALFEAAKTNDKAYIIPNNHVIGEYEYLVFDISLVTNELHYFDDVLSTYKTEEDIAELVAAIEAKGLNPDDYVYFTKGGHELKSALEKQNKKCNIVKTPEVTVEDAFSAGFAIVNREDKYNERAMQIIYAINTDVELRNYFQYGVRGTNYDLVDGRVVRVQTGDNVYFMNLNYTGDRFKAMYCDELKWNADAASHGALQNKDATFTPDDSTDAGH